MKERTSVECPHLNLSVEEAEENGSKYLWLLTDLDQFPMFKPSACTVDCKEKMIKIIDIVLFKHYKFSRDYFEDCKMVFGQGVDGMDLGEYIICIKENDFNERTALLTNLQYINGKIVRLCDVPKEKDEIGQEKNK
ncbi:hypothetical protein ACTFIZ_000652 [Dictyostelium cf. discoideum]